MRKLLFGLAAVAALAFAVPEAAMAQHHGGGGSHVSGGGGGGRSFSGGGGGRSFSGGGGRSFSGGSGRSFSANRGMAPRSFSNQGVSANRNFARSFDGNRAANRSLTNRNLAVQNNRLARNNRVAMNGRHGHHRRHFRGGGFYPYYYDDYAGYDACYQYVWTAGGYRYVDTCTSDYYGVY